MKKLLAILLAAMLVTGMTACGNDASNSSSSESESESTSQSENDMPEDNDEPLEEGDGDLDGMDAPTEMNVLGDLVFADPEGYEKIDMGNTIFYSKMDSETDVATIVLTVADVTESDLAEFNEKLQGDLTALTGEITVDVENLEASVVNIMGRDSLMVTGTMAESEELPVAASAVILGIPMNNQIVTVIGSAAGTYEASILNEVEHFADLFLEESGVEVEESEEVVEGEAQVEDEDESEAA